MSWQIVVILNVVVFALAQIVIKLIVSKLPRVQALSLQFLICAVLVALYCAATNQFFFNGFLFWIMATGFVNALGAYCQWRAIKVSLSKTTLFRPLSEVLALVLATIILKEFEQWNLWLVGGIVLCFFAIFLFRTGPKTGERNNVKEWFIFLAGMVCIFGIVTFLMKFFSFTVPRGQFLMSWYTGAFLGSLPLFLLEKQSPFRFPGKSIFLVPLASLAILANLATLYWAFELTLASKVLPITSAGYIFLPALSGWFFFRERKGLSKQEGLAFLIGIIGALLIIFS